MKRNDFILAIAILFLAGMSFLFYIKSGTKGTGMITVKVDGKVYGTYSLEGKQTIPIQKTNVLVIEDGKADMIKANCRDQICVEHKKISDKGETIICLPNKIVVEVIGGESAAEDAVAK